MLKLIVAAAAILLVGGCTIGTVPTQTGHYLSAYEESNLSSGAVLLARGDAVIFSEGFGVSNVGTGVQNTPETRFRIGSITKSMTWAAVHRLAKSGKLELDESVAELIGTSALPSKVTVRHLLNHQGGVADWGRFDDSREVSRRRSSLKDLSGWVASKPLLFDPGSDRSYSNSGYILLAQVIESVSGRSYGDFLSGELFRPLGMNATRHSVNPTTAGLATGYVQGHHPRPIVKAEDTHPSIFVGSGSVVSTVGDLFIWSRTAEAQQFPWDGRKRHGRSVTFMGGFVPGFGAWVEHYSDEDITVVFLTNLNNGAVQKIVRDLGAIMLEVPYNPAAKYLDILLDDGQSKAVSGAWLCTGGPEFTIRPVDDRLVIHWRHSNPAQPLWAQSSTEFFYPQDWARIAVRREGDRSVLTYEGPFASPAECNPRLRQP